MVSSQIVSRGVTDSRVLHAMLEMPREVFIPTTADSVAYDDCPQPVGCGQTISQPFIVARMLELIELKPTDTVLEVGTGTGYQAALLAKLVSFVVSIERHASLAEQARANLRTLGITNCEVRVGDGTTGAPDCAPFDAIIVAAAGPQVPNSLVAQLANGGRMLCPVGDRHEQRLVRVVRSSDGRDDVFEDLDAVVFVPLIGAEGFPAGE